MLLCAYIEWATEFAVGTTALVGIISIVREEMVRTNEPQVAIVILGTIGAPQ